MADLDLQKEARTPEPDMREEIEEAGEAEEYGLEPAAVRKVFTWLDKGKLDKVRAFIDDLHEADEADLIEQIDPEHRRQLVDCLRPGIDPEVFIHLRGSIREELINYLEPEEIAQTIAELDSDDAIELVEDIEEDRQREILAKLSARMRALVEQGLTFPDDSAGRLIQREVVALPQFWTVGKTIDYMRAAADTLPEDFYSIYVVDPLHRVVGAVALNSLVRTRRSVKLEQIQDTEIQPIPAEMDQEEVADVFRRYSLVSAPVVDDTGRLLGVITVDDIVDVIDEEAEEDLLKLSGVAESDIYSATWQTLKSRFAWLSVNLLTAVLASVVIGAFASTIDQVVALAVLMPIVASMGGNAGTQTLTVAVRALAMKELSANTAWRVIGKETLVASINGVIFAVVSGLVASLWFGDPVLGGVIALAMIATLAIAGLSGVLIPLTLDRLGADPAVASSVFLTTVTDIVGFFTFLGLAAWILL
ncbi:MAG: magnesium transporter [Pseudomonadota bacterium]